MTTFVGVIGDDDNGKIMRQSAIIEDGVNVKYIVDEEGNTGACAVLVTDGGKSRSLCAFLGAIYF